MNEVVNNSFLLRRERDGWFDAVFLAYNLYYLFNVRGKV